MLNLPSDTVPVPSTEELNKKVMQEFLETLSAGMVLGCKKAGLAGPALDFNLFE